MKKTQKHFSVALGTELINNLPNWYGSENWDSDVLPYEKNLEDWIYTKIRLFSSLFLNNLLLLKRTEYVQLASNYEALGDSIEELSKLYCRLRDEQSKSLLVSLIAYRLMGYRKVKLPLNTRAYWEMRRLAQSLLKSDNAIQLKFRSWKLDHQDLTKIGYPIEVYLMPVWVVTTFMIKQYEYSNDKILIKAEEGDCVIDAGGGWGDTALYFAHHVGQYGRIYSFEFEAENLEVIQRNLDLNPEVSNRIQIIQKALWDRSGEELVYSINGPATSLTLNQEGSLNVSTLSLDDFVSKEGLSRVDFIKMDIEGSELKALYGAEKTIRAFRPKLAIAVYHNQNDIITISNYLESLKLSYEFYLGHFTIYRGETILFAHVKKVRNPGDLSI